MTSNNISNVPKWLTSPEKNLSANNNVTNLIAEITRKNLNEWHEYEKNAVSAEDWKKLCEKVLSKLDDEIRAAEDFLVSCRIVIEDEDKLNQVIKQIPADVESFQNPVAALQVQLNNTEEKDAIFLLYQVISRLECSKNAISSAFSAIIYDKFGSAVFQQIYDATLFAEKAKKEAGLIRNLRIAFPERDDMDDDSILEAFRNGKFDDELDDYTLNEYVENKISQITPSNLAKELALVCRTEEDWKEILPTVLNIQFATKNNILNMLNKICRVYGENDSVYQEFYNRYGMLDNKAEVFYNKECASAMEEVEFACNYSGESENLLKEMCDAIKKEHGSIGFRRVMQYGMKSADTLDMQHFDLTAKMFGEEKAKELLRLTREEVAKNWQIPYDDELLNTPIDEWKDNPGR